MVVVNLKYLVIALFSMLFLPTKFAFLMGGDISYTYVTPLHLMGFLVLLGVTVLVLYERRVVVFSKVLLYLYLSFFLLLLMGMFFSPNIEYGLVKLFDFSTLVTLVVFVPFVLFRDENEVEFFFYCIILLAIGLCLVVIIAEPYSTGTAFNTGYGTNYLLIQHVSGMASMVILYHFMIRDGSVLMRVCGRLLMLLFLFVMTYVGGKGPVLFFVTTVLIISLSSIRYKNALIFYYNKTLLKYPVWVLVLLVAIVFFLMFFTGFSALLWRLTFIFNSDNYSQIERIENAKIAIDLFFQNPFFGIGFGGFSKFSYMSEFERFKYPHDIILELLSETGLSGAILFFSLLFIALVKLYKLKFQYKNSTLPTTVMALLIYTFCNALSSQNISNPALFGFIGISFVLEKLLKRGCIIKCCSHVGRTKEEKK